MFPGPGSSGVAASASVSGLGSSAIYHFRLVATHSGGTSYGADKKFSTTYTNSLGQTFNYFIHYERCDTVPSENNEDG